VPPPGAGVDAVEDGVAGEGAVGEGAVELPEPPELHALNTSIIANNNEPVLSNFFMVILLLFSMGVIAYNI